ncbi:MAG: hypothetical protein QXU88_00920 [Candidatus Woesearchaeota archaeon]
MSGKKGAEAIWYIIALVIGLIVLVVLVALFTGKVKLFGKAGEEIEKGVRGNLCFEQGFCEAGTACPPGSTAIPRPAAGWTDCTGICCKQVG